MYRCYLNCPPAAGLHHQLTVNFEVCPSRCSFCMFSGEPFIWPIMRTKPQACRDREEIYRHTGQQLLGLMGQAKSLAEPLWAVLLAALTATTSSQSRGRLATATSCAGPRLSHWHCPCQPMHMHQGEGLEMLTCGGNSVGVPEGPAPPCAGSALGPPSQLDMRVVRSRPPVAFAQQWRLTWVGSSVWQVSHSTYASYYEKAATDHPPLVDDYLLQPTVPP